MCGIIYVSRKDGLSASPIVAKRYHEQKKRGKEGFGYIAIENGYVKSVARECTEKAIMAKLKKETSSHILFHHRYPTSTENYSEVTHPIVVKNENQHFRMIKKNNTHKLRNIDNKYFRNIRAIQDKLILLAKKHNWKIIERV